MTSDSISTTLAPNILSPPLLLLPPHSPARSLARSLSSLFYTTLSPALNPGYTPRTISSTPSSSNRTLTPFFRTVCPLSSCPSSTILAYPSRDSNIGNPLQSLRAIDRAPQAMIMAPVSMPPYQSHTATEDVGNVEAQQTKKRASIHYPDGHFPNPGLSRLPHRSYLNFQRRKMHHHQQQHHLHHLIRAAVAALGKRRTNSLIKNF
ncbi:hypothetical protein EDD21DRAFT_159573 [Dissophora ornata]|nr:hypothetical protein EDD21DRAFT_159573 [Dissophora ornata]